MIVLHRPVEIAVISSPSALYHLKVGFREYSGRSTAVFRRPDSERLLSPIAVVQSVKFADV